MPNDIMPWVATGVALQAESEARAAREAAERAEAVAVVRGFVSDTATVSERQQYAEAVRLLYPVERHREPMSRDQRVACGVAILVWLAAIVCGAVWRARHPGGYQTTAEAAMEGGFTTAVGLPLACLIAALVVGVVLLPFSLIFGG